MSALSTIYVGTAQPLDEVAKAIGDAIGHPMQGDRIRATNGAEPKVELSANDLTFPHLDAGHELSAYELIVYVDGTARRATTKAIFAALAARGYRLLVEDDVEGFLDKHEPDKQKAASG